MKMIVMGFDGCAMKLLNKWKDKLPSFSYLMEHNKLGTLQSTIPPHTAPGWTSAFTGVSSGKHGIYQFWDTQAPEYMGKFMGSGDLKQLPVWEILNTLGHKTGVLNVPMTYPPKEIDGFMLTWPLHNTLRYAYPDDLVMDIAKHGGHYISDLNTMFQGDFNDYIEKTYTITKKRLITLKYLMERHQYDFYVSVFTEMDRVSHFYWNFMDEESLYYNDKVADELKDAVENIYKEADATLGEIMKYMDKESMLLVVSDHGFSKGNLNFYVQSYLL
ncbi:alkaline phosphatase family protein, partial [Anaerosporobacter sp.]|uniref:alkaline phosphatase family protein n=1 Tax=Anaerosporobacter sp. TaxID=1872529 RepID=UPI0028A1F22E